MNTQEIIDDLTAVCQEIENAKTELTEQQEEIRQTIARLQMMEVGE